MRIPVISVVEHGHDLCDELHFFCCIGCRSQSPYHDPYDAHVKDRELLPSMVPADVTCEVCGRDVHTNDDL